MNKAEREQILKNLLVSSERLLVRDINNLYPNVFTQEDIIDYYTELLKITGHYNHDQIVSDLQWWSNPRAINILYETALNEEIDDMDYKPIARRCTWALADIGTDEAKTKLKMLSTCGDEILEGFARKRLDNWEKEKYRKGIKHCIQLKHKTYLYLDYYLHLKEDISSKAHKVVTGQQDDDSIVVYQAFNSNIADYAVKNQKFGGTHYSNNRMTWIKPNFLWMMYRCGWAEKPNQERVLAISISKAFFMELLKEGELSSIKQAHYKELATWQMMLGKSEVRIQWDPHHAPDGTKLERKAIQIGIKGNLQKRFASKEIRYIEDITDFVKSQALYLSRDETKHLKIPIETEFKIVDKEVCTKLGIS